MKLYHYSLEKKILDEGINSFIKHEHTSIINSLINEFSTKCLDRQFCVFFNLDRRDDGAITVSVDSEKLNSDLLYVADQTMADVIFDKYINGKDYSDAVKKYVSSIMNLKDYNGEYDNPEVYYAEDVPAELLSVEFLYED